MILGTIKNVTSNGVTILIDGEDSPTQKEYLILSSYNPIINDRVLIEEIGDTYVVVGSVTKQYIAPTIDTAIHVSGSIANKSRYYQASSRYIFFKYDYSDGTYYIGNYSGKNTTDLNIRWKKITTS